MLNEFNIQSEECALSPAGGGNTSVIRIFRMGVEVKLAI